VSTNIGKHDHTHYRDVRPAPSFSRIRSNWTARSGIGISAIIAHLFLMVVYFDVVKHYRIMEILGGYLIKVWILPVTALGVLVASRIVRRKTLLFGREIAAGYLFLGGYFAFGVFSLFVNEGIYEVGKFGLVMFAPVTTYFIVLDRFNDMRSIEAAVKVLFSTAVVMALYAQYAFGFGSGSGGVEFVLLQTNVGVMSANEMLMEGAVRRLTLPGLEQNQFAAMLSILVLLGLHLFLYSQGWVKWFYLGGTGLLVWTVLATLSRSAIAGLFMGLLVFLWYYRQSRFLLMLGVAGIAYSVVSSDALITRLAELLYQIESYTGFMVTEYLQLDIARGVRRFDHFEIISRSLLAFRESPLVGVGLTGMLDRTLIQDHNRYLYLISTVGLLTTGCYVAFIFWLTSKCWVTIRRLQRRATNPSLGVALLAACVFIIVRLVSQSNEAYYYWILLGLTAAWVRVSCSDLASGPSLTRWPTIHAGGGRP
jgi:hypothetical protein